MPAAHMPAPFVGHQPSETPTIALFTQHELVMRRAHVEQVRANLLGLKLKVGAKRMCNPPLAGARPSIEHSEIVAQTMAALATRIVESDSSDDREPESDAEILHTAWRMLTWAERTAALTAGSGDAAATKLTAVASELRQALAAATELCVTEEDAAEEVRVFPRFSVIFNRKVPFSPCILLSNEGKNRQCPLCKGPLTASGLQFASCDGGAYSSSLLLLLLMPAPGAELRARPSTTAAAASSCLGNPHRPHLILT
jgi:hypothetical protein